MKSYFLAMVCTGAGLSVLSLVYLALLPLLLSRLLHLPLSLLLFGLLAKLFPMALSVAYWGGQKTGRNCAIRSRSMELDATPPEKTTGKPGYRLTACRVAASTA